MRNTGMHDDGSRDMDDNERETRDNARQALNDDRVVEGANATHDPTVANPHRRGKGYGRGHAVRQGSERTGTGYGRRHSADKHREYVLAGGPERVASEIEKERQTARHEAGVVLQSRHNGTA